MYLPLTWITWKMNDGPVFGLVVALSGESKPFILTVTPVALVYTVNIYKFALVL